MLIKFMQDIYLLCWTVILIKFELFGRINYIK